MAKIFSKLIKSSAKKTIDVAVNSHIESKNLKAHDISGIYFNSDLTAAVISYHVSDDTKIKVAEDEPTE